MLILRLNKLIPRLNKLIPRLNKLIPRLNKLTNTKISPSTAMLTRASAFAHTWYYASCQQANASTHNRKGEDNIACNVASMSIPAVSHSSTVHHAPSAG